jgi:two-component sensor histidine kinase
MRFQLTRIGPLVGALLFGALHFVVRLGTDWIFRSEIPDYPMPPLWSMLLTQLFGTLITAVVVYYLLATLRAQMFAVRELNHELRNALQVISYIVPQCAPADAEKGRAAVQRLTQALARVSKELGFERNDLRRA